MFRQPRKTNYNNFLVLFSVVLLLVYLYSIYTINYSLDTLCDEGYLFFALQNARKGIYHGHTFWPYIVNAFWTENFCSSISNLRYLRFGVHFVTVLFYLFAFYHYFNNKKYFPSVFEKLLFVLIVFLFGVFQLNGIIVAYNILQEFFIAIIICLFIISLDKSNKFKLFCFFAIGFFSVFSILTIFPSGVLIFLSILFFTWFDTKTIDFLLFLISLFLGIVASLIFFHFFILNLNSIFQIIVKTGQVISKQGYNYDFTSYLILIGLYIRNYFICIVLLLGGFSVSVFIKKHFNNLLSVAFFVAFMVIVILYQKKPVLHVSTIVSLPIILLSCFGIKRVGGRNSNLLFSIVSFKGLLLLFCFCLPILSSIGTNIPLDRKTEYFILPWAVLIFELLIYLNIKKSYKMGIFIFLFITILFRPLNCIFDFFVKEHANTKCVINHLPAKGVEISESQNKYFKRVKSIIESYGYKPKDKIFSTQLDLMTLAVLNAEPVGLYFMPQEFINDQNKHKYEQPAFIFLDGYDRMVMLDSLKALDWGFPEKYDSIYVDSPETIILPYSTKRTLYCLSSKKVVE